MTASSVHPSGSIKILNTMGKTMSYTNGLLDLSETAPAHNSPQTETTTRFRPAVIVGLGGSGVYVARRCRALLQERGIAIPTLEFVHVDADSDAFLDRPGLAAVRQRGSHFVNIGTTNAVLPLVRNPDGHDWIFDQLPDGVRGEDLEFMARGAGAGLKRACGRAAFLASIGHVAAAVELAVNNVMKLAAERKASIDENFVVEGAPVIYLISSLVGGTGSGAFLDAGLLARKYGGEDATVVYVGILPDALDEKQQTSGQRELIRANAYAALKELQVLQDAPEDFSLRVATGSGTHIDQGAGRRLFDLCYLIDRASDQGRHLSRTEDVLELAARLLLFENGTPFGSRSASTLVNLQTIQSATPCPRTGLGRPFSTFSCTTLRYPVERATQLCVWSKENEILEDFLKARAGWEEAAVISSVESHLHANALDELGARDDVQERLLRSPRDPGSLFADSLLSPEHGSTGKRTAFVEGMREKLNSLEHRFLPEGRAAIERNAVQYLGEARDGAPIRSANDEFYRDCFERYGALGARRAGLELEQRLSAMLREMADENDRWLQQGRKAAEDALNRELGDAGALALVFRQRDHSTRRAAISYFNEIVEGEFRFLARENAKRVFVAALEAARERLQALDRFLAIVDDLGVRLSAELSRLRQRSAARYGGEFVLEDEVADIEDIERLYRERPVDGAGVLGALCEREGGKAAFFEKLLAMNRTELHAMLSGALGDVYVPGIRCIDVIDYMEQKRASADPEEAARAARRLNAFFKMNAPFWRIDRPTADFAFVENRMLGAKPVVENGRAEPRAELPVWLQEYSEGGTRPPSFEALSTPYELQLVRYTHGARAAYLKQAADWKASYAAWSRPSSGFPLHIDARLVDLPDLDSSAAVVARERLDARRAFALGVALGLIVQRGHQYFLAVEKIPGDHGDDQAGRYLVGSRNDGRTAFDGAGAPDTGGMFDFSAGDTSKQFRLGEDRVRSREALERRTSQPRVQLLLDAIRDYVTAVGLSVVREQFQLYADWLEEHLQNGKIERKLRWQLESELATIKAYLETLQ
jgi:hypothetical protein